MLRIAVAVATADAMPDAFVVWRGIEESIERAAAFGYDGIELALKTVDQAARETGAIVTVEEHSMIGGLGGAVCEMVCECCPVPVVRVGVPDRFGESGVYSEILQRAGICSGKVVESARRAMAAKSG